MAPRTVERLAIDRSTPGTLKLCRWTTRAGEFRGRKKQEGDDFFHFATFFPVKRSNTAAKADSVPCSSDIIGVAEFLTGTSSNSGAVLQFCEIEDVHADSDAYISKIQQQTNSSVAVQRDDIVLAENREGVWCIGKVLTISNHTMDVEHLYNDETGQKTVSTCKYAQTKLMQSGSPCKITADGHNVFPSLGYKKEKKHKELRLTGASRVSQKQQRLRDGVFQEIMNDRAAVQLNATTPPPSPSMRADALVADMSNKYINYTTYRESHALPKERYKDLVGWEYEYQQLQNSLNDLQTRTFQFYYTQMVRLHHGIGKPNQMEAKSSWYVDVPKKWYDLEASDIAAPTAPEDDDDDGAGSMNAQLSNMSEDEEDDDARTEDGQPPIAAAASNTPVPPLPPLTSINGVPGLLPVAGQNGSTMPASTQDDNAGVDGKPSDASAESAAEQTNKKRSAVPAPTQDDNAGVDGEASDASAKPVAEQTNKKRSAVPAPIQDDNAGVDGEASDASADPVAEQTNKKRSSAASSSEATKDDDPDSGVELASPTGSPVKKKSRK